MARRLLFVAMGLVLLAAAADALVWWWAVRQVRDGFAAWADARRAAGVVVRAGPGHAAGWPLAATWIVPRFSVADGSGALAWSVERIALTITPADTRHLLITAGGAEHLTVPAQADIPVRAERLAAMVPLDQPADGTSVVADITGDALAADLPGLGATPATVSVQRIAVHVDMHPPATADAPSVMLSGTADSIGLPAGIRWPLGANIASVALNAGIVGTLRPAPDLGAALAAWRQGGGALRIGRLAMHWGRLGIDASGTATLDARMQPAGTVAMRVTGAAETLDALAQGNVLPARTATAAKALLALLTTPAADGAGPVTDLPMSVQDSVLSVGHVPVLRVPYVDWFAPR